MRKRKDFTYGVGYYYFTIITTPNHITMHRKNRREAEETYKKYKAIGKNVEWLGKWNGKKFEPEDVV
ncbi:MAG: hypothetical protein AAF502_23840 [Bacteroidota bacterium]